MSVGCAAGPWCILRVVEHRPYGIARCGRDAGRARRIDGRLPSGAPLGEAIEAIDAATDGVPAFYMVNCAHPSHFVDQLGGRGAWRERIKAIRANASRASHAELDEAEVLDRGDVAELAGDDRELRAVLPDLRVVGGCCGTDHEHVAAIAAALTD